MTSGAQDILVQSHMDLADLPLAFNSNISLVSTALGDFKASTRSIRGECTSPPPAATSLGLPAPEFALWRSPQCVIVCDHSLFFVPQPLWMDALYLRIRPSRFFLTYAIDVKAKGELYATRVTVQASPGANTSALSATDGGKALMQEAIFDNVGGDTQTVYTHNSSIVLQNCTFSNIRQRGTFVDFDVASGLYRFNGIITALSEPASATVLDTRFINVDANNLFWNEVGLMIAGRLTYSNVTTVGAEWDSTGTVVRGDDTAIVLVHLGELQAPQGPATLNSFPQSRTQPLRMGDPWITAVQQSLTEGSAMATETPPGPPSPPALGVAGDSAPSVAAVYTAFEFQDAFHEGVRDIEIRAHLDLRTLPIPSDPIVPFGVRYVFQIGLPGPSTRSIRGKCMDPPTGDVAEEAFGLNIAEEEPWQSPRCVIITSGDLFLVDRSRLWVDALHIQILGVSQHPHALWLRDYGSVYVTNSVMQGDRASDGIGVEVYRNVGGLYAQDCVFNALEGESIYRRVVMALHGTAYFKSCVFRDLSDDLPAVKVGAWEPLVGAIHVFGLNASMVLENCTVSGILNPDPLVVARGGVIYGDNPQQLSMESLSYLTYAPLPLAALANKSSSSRSPPPLQADDPWFVAAQQALSTIPASAYLANYSIRATAPAPAPAQTAPSPSPAPAFSGSSPTPPASAASPGEPGLITTGRDPTAPSETATAAVADGDGGSDSGMSMGAVVGIAIAAVAAVVLCVGIAAMAVIKRRRKVANDSKRPGETAGTVQNGGHMSAAAMPSEGPPRTSAEPGAPADPNHTPPGFPRGATPPHPNMYPLHAGAPYMHGYAPGYNYNNYNPAFAGRPAAGTGPHMPWQEKGAASAWPREESTPRAHSQEGRRPSLHAATAAPTVTAITKLTWEDFQQAGGKAESSLEELQVALDAMHSMQAVFHHRYTLGSSVDRRVGGQGVVQFASIAGTLDRAAIKFYLHRAAFERERELYTESELKAVMPATLAVEENMSGDSRTPYGFVFPPFVIIECGQSLDEWARDNENKDFITIFQALNHAVRSLRKLHAFGYAHRDIKPGNILRRPKQHDWTLIDFGCTAQIGCAASLMFSLKYAAPEVVHTLEAGCKTIVVDAAVDIWAIGVIAFELFTGERAFPAHGGIGAVSDAAAQEAIAGRAPLPWEGSGEATRHRLDLLRGMRRTVLQCLQRDPAKRPTSEALLRSWDHKFDNMQTRGTDWSAGS